jgi:hypothetical protein
MHPVLIYLIAVHSLIFDLHVKEKFEHNSTANIRYEGFVFTGELLAIILHTRVLILTDGFQWRSAVVWAE